MLEPSDNYVLPVAFEVLSIEKLISSWPHNVAAEISPTVMFTTPTLSDSLMMTPGGINPTTKNYSV